MMAAEASITRKKTSHDNRISDTLDLLVSTGLHAAADGQTIPGNELMTWDEHQQGIISFDV